ncbi:MAG: leucine-rich repeat protein [Oscillospiraceae bacterium]|nr:leucine-rich repeat protein [Oscillospiraceae bacterium]
MKYRIAAAFTALSLLTGTAAVPGLLPEQAVRTAAADRGTYLWFTYYESEGGIVISRCDTSATGVVIVPEEIDGLPVTRLSPGAFADCTSILTVMLPEGLTEITAKTFSNCTRLVSVNLPDSLTAIGTEAFLGCTALSSLTLPGSLTSLGPNCFSGCTALSSLALPGSLTSLGTSCFTGCTSLGECTLPDGITRIPNACFKDCTGLGQVTLPAGCTELGGSAFSGCAELTQISLPDGITQIPVACFEGCTGLKQITLPAGCTGIGSSAFEGCTGLTQITLPDSITEIGSAAFQGCTGLTQITLPAGITGIEADTFSGCKGLTQIRIPESVTVIGTGAFEHCEALTEVTLPEGLTEIGPYAFGDCSSLTSLTVPETVTSIREQAFRYCTALQLVTILAPGCTIDSASDTIPCGICGYIGSTAHSYATKNGRPFHDLEDRGCRELIASGTSGTVTWRLYGDGEEDCELRIGGSGALTSDSIWKSYKSRITRITVQDGITSIGDNVFREYGPLTHVTIAGSVKEIGQYAFGEAQIGALHLGSGVETLGMYSFGNVQAEDIVLPASVHWVNQKALSFFWDAKRVLFLNPKCTVSCYGTPPIGAYPDGYPGCNGGPVVYGYAGSYAESFAYEFLYRFQPVTQGDVDLSGETGVLDAVALQKHLVREKSLDTLGAAMADLNGNDTVDVTDLVLLKQLLTQK